VEGLLKPAIVVKDMRVDNLKTGEQVPGQHFG
jgi:hypothetical protein